MTNTVELLPDENAFHAAVNFAYKQLLRSSPSQAQNVLVWRKEKQHQLWASLDPDTKQIVGVLGISTVDFDPLAAHQVPMVVNFAVIDAQKQRQGIGKGLVSEVMKKLPPSAGLTAFALREQEPFFHACGFGTYSSNDMYSLCRWPKH